MSEVVFRIEYKLTQFGERNMAARSPGEAVARWLAAKESPAGASAEVVRVVRLDGALAPAVDDGSPGSTDFSGLGDSKATVDR
jgi:hypothetical protein